VSAGWGRPVLKEAAAAAAALLCSSCFLLDSLEKRSDAMAPVKVTQEFASKLNSLMQTTNLARDSSQVLQLRMLNLFPGIDQFYSISSYNGSAGQSVDVFSSSDWDTGFATGLAAAFDSDSDPTDPVSLSYWNDRVYPACDWYLGSSASPDLDAAGAIFSSLDVLMSGEQLPDVKAAPETYWAFLAARNAFLYPYTASSPEVQALATLYKNVSSDPNINVAAWKGGGSAYESDRSPEQLARLAVCVAALSAPQFMIGNPSKVDVIRRLAYGLGGRRPTFKEISEFVSGSLDLRSWIGQLQQTDGYFAAVGSWHKDWLGLRPFIFNGTGESISAFQLTPNGWSYDPYFDASAASDPRTNFGIAGLQLATFTRFSNGYNLYYAGMTANEPGWAGAPPPSGMPFALSWSSNDSVDIRAFTQPGGVVDPPQEFDPRTAIVSYEFGSCPSSGQYVVESTYQPKVVYVLKSAFETQLSVVEATLPGFPFDSSHCAIPNPDRTKDTRQSIYPLSAKESDYTAGGLFPSYYLCRSDDAATYLNTHFSATNGGPYFGALDAAVTLGGHYAEPAIYYGCNGTYNTAATNARPVFRYRRFSPVVTSAKTFTDQNGASVALTWLANQNVLVPNGLQRFLLTCAFRPGPEFASFHPTWAHEADAYWHYLDDMIMPSTWYSADFTLLVNPYYLNQFRCGTPSLPALQTPEFTQAVNDAAYPFAYDHSPAGYASGSVSPASLNTLINTAPLATFAAFSQTPNPTIPTTSKAAQYRYATSVYTPNDEAGAAIRLEQQLRDEPLNLLKYVLKNGLSYGEMFTARYTVGGPELELYYRTQGYFLPAYPDAATAALPKSSANPSTPDQYYKIPLDQFNTIPANALHGEGALTTAAGAMAQDPVKGANYYMMRTDAPQYAWSQNATIPARAGAGVLTMPALLSPMTVQNISLRSIAHRIFVRFLCGEPNVVQLTSGEAAIHQKYLESPSNPTDEQHKNSSSTCYQCHINLDPLAAALSINFLNTVGTANETLGTVGELFAPAYPPTYMPFLMGVRAGPFRSSGAFLGKEILPSPASSGFQQVGTILSQDSRFAVCLAGNVFTKLFGRAPGLADASLLQSAGNTFTGDGLDFNRLIQDLAVSAAYDKDE
jgi:hypothetical protein